MAANMDFPDPRPLDHCVLPTASLATARARLGALGFTVAPDAAHPFGTANACVFFADGSYLEPLAVVDAQAADRAIGQCNTFVARDRSFRQAHGEEGFSAMVLGTDDAAADHARFVRQGISAGPPLSFSRSFVDAHGVEAEASFKLAFAAPADGANFFFVAERVKVPAVDRSSLQRHENGVEGIARILMTGPEPAPHPLFLAALTGLDPFFREDDGCDLDLANAAVSLLPPAALRHAYGTEAAQGDDLRLHGIVFHASDLASLRRRLSVAGVGFAMHETRLVVPPAPGQGAVFLFEEPDP